MEAEARPEEARPPKSFLLCVDLDGTLVKTDLLFEMLLLLLKRRPLQLFRLPVWLLGGKAHLKWQLARRVEVDVTCLPYHEPLLAYLSEEHLLGRTLVWCWRPRPMNASPARSRGIWASSMRS